MDGISPSCDPFFTIFCRSANSKFSNSSSPLCVIFNQVCWKSLDSSLLSLLIVIKLSTFQSLARLPSWVRTTGWRYRIT